MSRRRNSRPNRPFAVDLFAGAGGMSLGFEQAGFDVAVAVELDPIHCATHEFNFPNCRVLCKDIRDVAGPDLVALANAQDREVDMVFGGPPCQGFSMMGKRSIDDPRNSLVREFIRIVAETGTKAFVFENVRGLTIGKQVQFLVEMISEFEALGYQVALPWQVLNAAHFGVPQDRQRLFIMGTKKGLPYPVYPTPATVYQSRNGELPSMDTTPTVWDAIGDLPDVEGIDALLSCDEAAVKLGRPAPYAKILRGEAQDPGDYSYPRVWPAQFITSSLRTRHSESSKMRFRETAFGRTEPVSRFFKLDPDGVSNTLRAGTASDRGAFTSPRPIHPYHERCITIREAARLHSYPD